MAKSGRVAFAGSWYLGCSSWARRVPRPDQSLDRRKFHCHGIPPHQCSTGSLTSAFLMGYALFQTIGGWLADRLGSRRVLAVGVLWWGIFTSLTAAVPSTIISAVLVLAAADFFWAGEAVLFPLPTNLFRAGFLAGAGVANGLIFAGVGVGRRHAISDYYIMVHYGWRGPSG